MVDAFRPETLSEALKILSIMNAQSWLVVQI